MSYLISSSPCARYNVTSVHSNYGQYYVIVSRVLRVLYDCYVCVT